MNDHSKPSLAHRAPRQTVGIDDCDIHPGSADLMI